MEDLWKFFTDRLGPPLRSDRLLLLADSWKIHRSFTDRFSRNLLLNSDRFSLAAESEQTRNRHKWFLYLFLASDSGGASQNQSQTLVRKIFGMISSSSLTILVQCQSAQLKEKSKEK